jgi:hypothetical protein
MSKMMITDGSERIIWSTWIMLSWIAVRAWTKISFHICCPTSKPKSSSAPAISQTKVLLIHPITSWYFQIDDDNWWFLEDHLVHVDHA